MVQVFVFINYWSLIVEYRQHDDHDRGWWILWRLGGANRSCQYHRLISRVSNNNPWLITITSSTPLLQLTRRSHLAPCDISSCSGFSLLQNGFIAIVSSLGFAVCDCFSLWFYQNPKQGMWGSPFKFNDPKAELDLTEIYRATKLQDLWKNFKKNQERFVAPGQDREWKRETASRGQV